MAVFAELFPFFKKNVLNPKSTVGRSSGAPLCFSRRIFAEPFLERLRF